MTTAVESSVLLDVLAGTRTVARVVLTPLLTKIIGDFGQTLKWAARYFRCEQGLTRQLNGAS